MIGVSIHALVEVAQAIVRHGGIQMVNGMMHLVAFQEHTIEDALLIATLAFRIEAIAQLGPDTVIMRAFPRESERSRNGTVKAKR